PSLTGGHVQTFALAKGPNQSPFHETFPMCFANEQFVCNNNAQNQVRQMLPMKLAKAFPELDIVEAAHVDIRIDEVNHPPKRSVKPPEPINVSNPLSSSR